MFGEEMSGTEMSGANISRGVHQAEDISMKEMLNYLETKGVEGGGMKC